ncbi:MAG: glycosyltransferase [Algicola sp.]|nr:glycosyltransferase [Algicola sp.]
MNQILLSISVTTYNHEAYIEQCLDSLLMQKTNFQYEIILGEDDSSDATRHICQRYANTYPDKIRLFLRSRKDVIYINGNPTGRFNFIENLKAAKGKYIALCEGDDYWTDPLKLQKQVDFLENNLNFSYCGSSYQELQKDIFRKVLLQKEVYSFEDVINKNVICTASLMFRTECLNNLPSIFTAIPAADWYLQLHCLQNKKAYVFSEEMVVYRKHGSSIWSSLSRQKMGINGVNTLKAFKKVFRSKEKRYLISQAIKKRKKEFGLDSYSRFKQILKKIKQRLI